jgi:CAAX protease family protein
MMARPSAYIAHDTLVATARHKAQLWRLILGLVIVAAVSLSLSAAGARVLAKALSPQWLLELPQGATPTALLALLFSFAFVILGVAVAVRVLQMRSLPDVLGRGRNLVVQFWRVLKLHLILLVAIMLLPPYDMGAPMELNMPVALWVALLPISLVAVLVQVSAEEILFRGYIQQSLAARFRSPAIWIFVPSLLFALGHFVPDDAGDNAALIAVWAGVFGILMADLTARAGTLGPAIAVHLFNNVTAILIISSPTSLNGLALFLLPFEMSDTNALRPWLAVDFAMMLISWLTARLAIRR